ncbi:hypothetical protein FGW84_01175, partial [Xylella fastidiosa subsp. multiplex]|nr:hypothetical protein [Xylella fastidiosa subsp. multiplex]
SYIVGVEPSGRYWFHSALADATSYRALDRYEAESQPDRIGGLTVIHRTVFVLGKLSGEFFYNSGASEGTFQRPAGTQMQPGCAPTPTLPQMGNTVFRLRHDGRVYRL